jgi:hypothetical protein
MLAVIHGITTGNKNPSPQIHPRKMNARAQGFSWDTALPNKGESYEKAIQLDSRSVCSRKLAFIRDARHFCRNQSASEVVREETGSGSKISLAFHLH